MEESSAIAQEAAENAAAIAALEEREPAQRPGAERERDERGRYSPARPFDENELRSRIDLEEVKNAELLDRALQSGLVIPDDSMSPELWAKAFRGRMAQAEREGVSTPPHPVESRTEESAEPEPEAIQDGDADQAILTAYNQRAAAFAAENPDFSDVVGSLEIPTHVAPAVELAILAETNGPELAYELGRNPAIVEELGTMTPAQASSRIGRLAEHLDRLRDWRTESGYNALSAEISPDALQDFQRKAQRLHETDPLTPEELQAAQAISCEAHVNRAIVALGDPRLGFFLVRNPHVVAKLNSSHPLAVVSELTKMQAELDAEAAARPEKRLPRPITPTRKASATDHALSDSLSTEEWAKRFRKKMNYGD